jgi:large subunit ribosomal protein L15
MQLNTLNAKSPRVTSARVGRGGKRGKTSGRGTKGQNARAGAKKRPEMRDLLKKLPKRRGFGKNRSRTVAPQVIFSPVNLSLLEKSFIAGDTVTPMSLIAKGLVGSRGGYILPIKILGTGTLTKKISVVDCKVSASAEKMITSLGGTITNG